MGGRQSKEQFLYEQALQGNFRSLAALRNQGAGLEWTDEQGKTALIVACSRHDLFQVAETLIELGSNVNAYSRGSDGGTPLHHAAKSGLLLTVNLLLSRGANVYVRNDNGQTPLDVAIEEEKADIFRAIEGHMCTFSGWLREYYGPSLLEVVATSWVVIIPSGPLLPPKLTIYANLLSTEPSKVIDLRWDDNEEPNFQGPDPSLIIYDKFNKTRYKFSSGNPGDWQQIQRLYNACRGIREVTSRIHQDVTSPVQHNTHNSAPSNGNQTLVENQQQSNPINSSKASEENGWGNATHDSTQNGWGSLVGPTISEVTNGWMDRPPKEKYNGWGTLVGPTIPDMTNGWMDKPPKEEYNGWGTLVEPTTSKVTNGWMDEPPKEEYNEWGSVSGPTTTTESCSNGWDPLGKPTTFEVSTASNGWDTHKTNELPSAIASVPSAPPLLDEDFYDDPIQNPGQQVDFSTGQRVDSSTDTCTNKEALRTSEANCVICWEMPAEAACVPCGHMAACMRCLNEVKSSTGDCPVCRAKIDHVIRIYVASV